MRFSFMLLRRKFFVFCSLIAFSLSCLAADFTISGIPDEQVEEFIAYQSPIPEANNPNGNITWELYNPLSDNPLANWIDFLFGEDLVLLRTLPIFTGMNTFQMASWLASNYQNVSAYTIDTDTGIVTLPPQKYSSTPSKNSFHAILIATDTSGARAALHWEVEITENTTASFSLLGINSQTILERNPYQSSKPFVIGSPLLFPDGQLSYTLSGDGAGTYFYSDSNTGQVSIIQNIRYDADTPSNNDYNLTLIAKDDKGNVSPPLTWTVSVLPLPPGSELKMSGLPASIDVQEHSNFKSAKPQLSGFYNTPVTFSLNDSSGLFYADSSTGIIYSQATLIYDFDDLSNNTHSVTLTATEFDGEEASHTMVINIKPLTIRNFSIVNRLNEKIVEANSYTSSIPSISGSFYPNLTYSIDGYDAQLCEDQPNLDICAFYIDSATGVVTMQARSFISDNDPITANTRTIIINAHDKIGTLGQGTLSVRVLFDINRDTDGDGVKDTIELAEGTNPLDASDYQTVWDVFTPDATSFDADADGIGNIDESGGINPYGDNNHDGVPNYLDPYDRGDGKAALCTIKMVANFPDGDGFLNDKAVCDTNYGLDPIFDRDQDGIPNFRDIDSDGDGIPDVIEGGLYLATNTTGIAIDTDGDGIPDYLDFDSDGDGIPDSVENHKYSDTTNMDGVPDIFHISTGDNTSSMFNGALKAQNFNEQRIEDAINQGLWLADFDKDGVPNHLDLDSDSDGIPDRLEGTSNGDLYTSLRISLFDIDANNNGIPDIFDVAYTGGIDTVGNEIDDRFDATLTGGTDTQIAGIDDHFVDRAKTAYKVNTSLDYNDRIALAPNTNPNSNPDFINPDSDGDCIGDSIEAGLTGILNGSGIDTAFTACFNGDGSFKDFNCLLDSDNDGIPDFRDLDSDNDGLMDVDEASTALLDRNRDGLCDNPDRLITDRSLLKDTDGDGTPDYLDLQSDGSVFDVTFVQPPLLASDYDVLGQLIPTTDVDQDGIDDIVDTAPTQFGMLAIDCDDPANASHSYCAAPPVDVCDTDPDHPSCADEEEPAYCSHPDSAQWPECFEEPAQCELDNSLPECTPPPPIDCSINFSHPTCMAPSLNPKNGKIKTNERGSMNSLGLFMLLIVWFARRRLFA